MTQTSTSDLESLLHGLTGATLRHLAPRRLRLDLDAQTLATLLGRLRGHDVGLQLSSIGCVDRIDRGQFELVYQLWSEALRSLICVHVRIPREPGVQPSIHALFAPAAVFERDIHEMFGIDFPGNPDLSPLVLTDWDGPPPLRKDFDAQTWASLHSASRDYRPDWLMAVVAQGGGIVRERAGVKEE